MSFIWTFPYGPGFPLQSVVASGAWQSVEHITSQASNAGLSASIPNADIQIKIKYPNQKFFSTIQLRYFFLSIFDIFHRVYMHIFWFLLH